MMRLVNDDQSGGFLHIPPVARQPLDGQCLHLSGFFSHSIPGHGFLYLLHQLPAVRHYPDTGTGTVEEFSHHRRQQMSLSCACRHLHHDTLMKLPLLKEPGLHFLLVVTKTVVFAIHRRMPVATDNKKRKRACQN